MLWKFWVIGNILDIKHSYKSECKRRCSPARTVGSATAMKLDGGEIFKNFLHLFCAELKVYVCVFVRWLGMAVRVMVLVY